MAYITLDMLRQVAAEHKVLLLGYTSYKEIKFAVMVNPERKRAVWRLANAEWAAQQLEKLLDNNKVVFVPKTDKHYKDKVSALEYVARMAKIGKLKFTETPNGMTIGRWSN